MKTKRDENVRRTWTIPEAARAAGTGERAIREAVKAGTIPSIRLSRNILIPRAAFTRWLDSGGQIA